MSEFPANPRSPRNHTRSREEQEYLPHSLPKDFTCLRGNTQYYLSQYNSPFLDVLTGQVAVSP